MSARNKNATGRRSWRETPAKVAGAPTPASKWPLRVLLALTVVLLIACFAWLLWQPAKPEPMTHFVALTTGRCDLLSVPPILFEQETLAPLRKLGDSHSEFQFIDGEESQRSAKTATIESLLGSLKANADDRLIVYVSAHGVSEDGQAYILGPGFDVRHSNEGRYLVKELLAAVARQSVATKLVVFDCSRLAVLPRAGMVLNEFASLLQQAARECGDEKMWIATAASEQETSPLGLKQRCSIFGSALAAGLIGSADERINDGDADLNVTLVELAAFMKQQCAAAPVATPTPQFHFCGSEVTSSRRENPVLLRIYATPASEAEELASDAAAGSAGDPSQRPQAAEESAGDANPGSVAAKAPGPPEKAPTATEKASAPEESSPAESTSPSDSKLASDEQTAADVDPQQPQAKSNQPLAPTTDAVAIDSSSILQVWRLRDQLQQDQQPTQLSPLPADFAPHFWNELNTALVDWHLQQIGHPIAGDVVSSIAEYQHGLQRLIEPTTTGVSQLVTESLDIALRRYQSGEPWKRLSSMPPAYAYTTLFRRRSIQRANQYVAWHRTAHASVGDAGSAISDTTRAIARLLVDLTEMDRKLAELEARPLDSRLPMKALQSQQAELQGQFTKLDRRIASPAVSQQEKLTPGVQRQLEDLVSTAWATADLRAAALMAEPVQPKSPRENSSPNRSTTLRHLRLECLLVQLADPEAAWSQEFQAIAAGRQRLPASDVEVRSLFRQVGKEIQEFYAGMPSRIDRSCGAGAAAPSAPIAEKLIAILHPRDAKYVSTDSNCVAGFVVPRLQPPAQIALQNPQRTTLTTERWIALGWGLQLENVSLQSAEVELGTFDQNQIRIRSAVTDEEILPGGKLTFPAHELQARKQLPFEVFLHGDAPSRANRFAVPLKLRLLSTDRREFELAGEAQLQIPRPNRIDLTAWSLDPQSSQYRRGEAGLRLEPFPNRTTTFRLSLANFSDEEKNLRLELFAVPRQSGDSWPPGLLLDASDQPHPQLLRRLSAEFYSAPLAVAEIDLPADGKPYRVALKRPGAGVEEPNASATGGEESNAEKAPAKPPAAADITYGLVGRLVDRKENNDDLVKWIEIATRRPTSYLGIKANYDDARNELRFLARPLDLDGKPGPDMPPQSAEKPVIVSFFGDGQVLEAGGEGQAIISSADQQGEIFVKLTRTISGSQILGLLVDGFPRSHQWEINFDNGIIRPALNRTSVNIDWVGMPGTGDQETGIAPRLYSSRPRLAFPPIDEKVWPVLMESQSRICAFDVSRGARQLKLRLLVDAPRDAFNSVDGDDVLEIGWKERQQQPLRRFYSDRAMNCSLTEITKQGDLAVAATVDDLEVSLDAAQTIKTSRGLQAQLRLEGSEAADDARTIVFDDKPPTITVAELKKKVIQIGAARFVRADLMVTDLSGVQLVEAWVLPEQPASEADLDPKAASKYHGSSPELLGTYSEQSHPLSLRISVPEKLGKYFLVLRVTDRSGQTTTTLTIRDPIGFEVVAPPPPPKPGPVIHDLVGTVILGSKPAPAGLKVTVKENPKLSASTASGGEFKIENVPAGSYTLLVKGTHGSCHASGELKAELAKQADYEIQIDAKCEIAGTPE